MKEALDASIRTHEALHFQSDHINLFNLSAAWSEEDELLLNKFDCGTLVLMRPLGYIKPDLFFSCMQQYW